ncbi:hypothetical protein HG530_002776 [Fusarium avenaceum]|nr:hypothetical protein HG530_002776 [Fusarium avenaceum]
MAGKRLDSDVLPFEREDIIITSRLVQLRKILQHGSINVNLVTNKGSQSCKQFGATSNAEDCIFVDLGSALAGVGWGEVISEEGLILVDGLDTNGETGVVKLSGDSGIETCLDGGCSLLHQRAIAGGEGSWEDGAERRACFGVGKGKGTCSNDCKLGERRHGEMIQRMN